jgi:exopolysaccharide biosynthesis WecB/TagA/CpsF family protein
MINLILNKDNKKLTTFLNPFSYLLARKQKDLFSSFNIEIDGILLVLILRIFGFHFIRKSFDMTSLARIIFNKAISESKSVYLIGTKPEVIDQAVNNIREKFINLNICGFRDGYFSVEEKKKILNNIIKLNPDYVICGMGTPKQEEFLLELSKAGWNGRGYTCGGFLHQTAQNIKYYPKWIDLFNLRAFYRVYDEPKLIKRYILEYPIAIIYIVSDLIIYKWKH